MNNSHKLTNTIPCKVILPISNLIMSSLKGNIILNYINTISGLIFPIITFPYAARVLMPEGIGVVNFQNSIIGYIVLLTSLGIPLYAVREIAKCRNDLEVRDRTTMEILILSVLLCFLGYVIVWLLGVYVHRIHEEATLFYILSLTIIFTGIGAQWFYQGVEDFLFITVRGLVVRTLCTIGLFIFVKDKDDLLIYGFYIIGATVGNNLINFIHLRKYLKIARIKWNQLNISHHIKPAFNIFLLNVVISIYIQLNTVMLGFMTDDRAVGLFSSGTKLTHLITVVLTSLGTAMLPRCSNLISEKRYDDFNTVITKSYHLLMFSAIPLTVGTMLLARPLVYCFCGGDFTGAVPVVLYTAPTIILIGMTQVIGIQILYPYGKENLVIISTFVAAVVNVILNLLLIPLLAEKGAAISTLISEFSVLAVQIRLGKDYIPFRYMDKQIFTYLFAAFLMSFGIFVSLYLSNAWWQMSVGVVVGSLVYMSVLYLRNDEMLHEVFKIIRRHK